MGLRSKIRRERGRMCFERRDANGVDCAFFQLCTKRYLRIVHQLFIFIRTRRYGPKFTTGDVIGCCVNFLDHTCFYTKNGKKLGDSLMCVFRRK